jgi:hypothetical protein
MCINPSIMRPTAPNCKAQSENVYHQTESRDLMIRGDSLMRLKRESDADFCVPDPEEAQYWDSSDGDFSDGESFEDDSSDRSSSDEDLSDADSSDEEFSDEELSDVDSSGGESSDEDSSSEANFSDGDSNPKM